MLAWYICSFVIFQGIRSSIAKKPFSFVIFQGDTNPPPLDPPMTEILEPDVNNLGLMPLTLIKTRTNVDKIWFLWIYPITPDSAKNIICNNRFDIQCVVAWF